jgi:transposase
MIPHDLPPWPVVYHQLRRWMAAGCFESIVHDVRILLRRAADRTAHPSAAILDSWTVQSTPESGARAGYDGHKRRKGSKVHAAVDTLGHLLALVVTPANEQDRGTGVRRSGLHRRRACRGCADPRHRTGRGEAARGRRPERGFVLLPKPWVVEHDFAWASRFRRLARDYKRLAATLAGLHFLAFACLMLHQFTQLMVSP